MDETLCTVPRLYVAPVNIVNEDKEADKERERRPASELKEVRHVSLTDAIVGDNTVMVHVIDAPITSTTMTDAFMRSQVAAPLTCLIVVIIFVLLVVNVASLIAKLLLLKLRVLTRQQVARVCILTLDQA